MRAGDQDGEFTSVPHRFKRVLKYVEEQLSQLSIFYEYEGCIVLDDLSDRRTALLELTPQELQSVRYGLAKVDRCALVLWRAGDAAKTGDKIVDAIDLSNDHLREIISKVYVCEPFRKKLSEGPDGDQGVLDLMCDTRRKGTE